MKHKGSAKEKRRDERFDAARLTADVLGHKVAVLDVSFTGIKLGPVPGITLGPTEVRLSSVDAMGQTQTTTISGEVVRIDRKSVILELGESNVELANFVIREATTKLGVKPFLFRG